MTKLTELKEGHRVKVVRTDDRWGIAPGEVDPYLGEVGVVTDTWDNDGDVSVEFNSVEGSLMFYRSELRKIPGDPEEEEEDDT